jgi:DNA-binding NarL/FixJ family response regulator
VYLQCVPENGEPHFLQSASTSGPSLTVRATEGPSERRPYHGEALPFGLTPAELTVLQAAAQGLTVPETAVELHKGAETVKSQRNKIILKIGARNMTHAVCIAAEHGLVGSTAAAAA